MKIPNSEFRIPNSKRYASNVLLRIIVLLSLLFSASCMTSSVVDRFDCPEDALGDWQIAAAWLDRELTPSEARVEVLTANLSKDACEARWE